MARDKKDDPFPNLPRRNLFSPIVDASVPSRVLDYDLPARPLPPGLLKEAEKKAAGRAAKKEPRAKGRGRPALAGVAMTAAEKQAAYRARRKAGRGVE